MEEKPKQMKGFWLRHASTILSEFLEEQKTNPSFPLASVVDAYVRKHPEMGKKDRQGSLNIVYFVIRNFLALNKKVDFLCKLSKRDFAAQTSLDHTADHVAEMELTEKVLKKYREENKRIDLLIAFFLYYFFPQSLKKNIHPPLSAFEIADKKYQKFFKRQNKIKQLSLAYSFDEQLVKQLVEDKNVKETEALLKNLHGQAKTFIRVNAFKSSQEQLQEYFSHNKIETANIKELPALEIKTRTNFFNLESYKNGEFEIQDKGSQMISLLAEIPQPSKIKKSFLVIDTCAGGGGKTLHLSNLMNNKGTLIAYDVDRLRLKNLFQRSKKSGSKNIEIFYDSNDALVQQYKYSASVVLIDAPCSGTGVCKRHPENAWRYSLSEIKSFQENQKKILEQYASLVKRGGRLIYATCSVLPMENQEVARWFSKTFENTFMPLSAKRILNHHGINKESDNCFLDLQGEEHDVFFVAVWQKKLSPTAK